jgi:hypothetical protein
MKNTNKKTMKLKLQGRLSLEEQTFWLEKVVIVRIKEHLLSLIDSIQKQVNSVLFRIIAAWKR